MPEQIPLMVDAVTQELRQFASDETIPQGQLLAALQVALTGLVTSNVSGVLESDTILQAIGKLQAQASGKVDKVAGKVLSSNDFTDTERTKLTGIATGATKNATDAQLRDRSTHTGAQAIGTVTGLQSALDAKEAAGTAASQLTAHTNATDPHPQYTTVAGAAAAAPVQSVAGRTGAVTLSKDDVGLSAVDNTADSAKPVSTAQQAALNSKANLASPALTGTPTAPTAADGTSTTQIATTAFVQGAVGGYLAKTTTGGTTTLTTVEASNPVIKISGALTSNAVLEIPVASKRNYSIENATTGAFTLTVKHVGLTPSVLVSQGKRNIVMTNGVGAYDAINDFESIALTGTPTAPTAGSTTNNTQIATTAFVQTGLGTKVDKVANQRLITATEATKLTNIAEQATKNATDAALRDRATHTGTQPITSITGLEAQTSAGVVAAVAMAQTFTSVPSTFQAWEIVVTQPHLRKMVWSSASNKYVRAPWHPVGQVGYFLRSIPAGFLEVRSDVVLQKADFPDLAEYLGVAGSTFVLDEARGEFIRNLDSGRGKDAGRVIGSHQGDAGRNLTGTAYITAEGGAADGWLSTYTDNGAFRAAAENVGVATVAPHAYVEGRNRGLTLDASRQWPVANEFRPTNLAYRFAVTY